MATNTYVALDKITVSGSSTNTVTLSAIPQTYKDLVLVTSGKQDSLTDMAIRFNSDTAGNYSKTLFYGTGSSTGTANYTTANQIFVTYQSTTEANVTMHIMNYTSTSVQKTVLAKGSATGTGVQMNAGAWRKSPLEAISSITVFPASGANFSDGFTISLYGIRAEGISPTTKATGGAVYSDDVYYYHVFGASGAFIPTQSITADILQIAGGGSGGSYNGGGGGAGGLLAFTSQSLTAISHNVTVGGGGPGAVNSRGNQGSNSQFASLTASVGGGFGADYVTVAAGGTGGSGGGANPSANGTTAGGSPTSGQGNAGGSGSTNNSTYRSSGGGGGAGAAGGNGIASTPGTAGAGGNGSSAYSSWGIATGTGQNIAGTVWYAGGGGGASTVGAAGNGGATAGNSAGASLSALANSGSGSGGAYTGNAAGNGGSGLVIIRYAK